MTTRPMPCSAAVSLLEDYVTDPERYWPSAPQAGEHRQVSKLRRAMQATADAVRTDTTTALDQMISLAQRRAPRRPPPIYVIGLGGSGSHWLAEILTDLLGAVDCGEVYFPSPLLDRMEDLHPDQRGFLVDCLHLTHAFGHVINPASPPLNALASKRAINSAAGVIHPRYRRWDPRCFAVHMQRDPRDQVASVAFRKAGYRREIAPDASDDTYLMEKARAAVRNHEAWREASIDADFLCRYEELRAAPTDTLDRLLRALGERIPPARIAEVAGNHDADLMQRGLAKPRGNFFVDDGRGSRREPDERQRAMLHSELVEIRSAAGYPADECLGRASELRPTRVRRKLRFSSRDDLGTLLVRDGMSDGGGSWRVLGQAVGEVAVPGGVPLKLRVRSAATPEAIASLSNLPPDALDSLCLAGNMALDDSLLEMLAKALHGLGELDLARTAITADGLVRLTSLEALRGLSLLNTTLSESAVSALREEAPSMIDCQMLLQGSEGARQP